MALELLERAELAGARSSVARYLRWQPDGAWGAFDEAVLVGTVTLLRFGAVGFVGCMAVAPEQRGRGLGRQLLAHAHEAGRRAGVTTFLLEATSAGEPLYHKLGYVVEGETVNLTAARPCAEGGLLDLRARQDEIVALDRAATDSTRAHMVTDLLARHRGATIEHDGLTGYALAVDGRLGPAIARDEASGRALLDRVAPACNVASVPAASTAALAAVADHGFAPVRQLRRMRLGAPVPTPGWLWALASPGAG